MFGKNLQATVYKPTNIKEYN